MYHGKAAGAIFLRVGFYRIEHKRDMALGIGQYVASGLNRSGGEVNEAVIVFEIIRHIIVSEYFT